MDYHRLGWGEKAGAQVRVIGQLAGNIPTTEVTEEGLCVETSCQLRAVTRRTVIITSRGPEHRQMGNLPADG